jgi:hypothetical protein
LSVKKNEEGNLEINRRERFLENANKMTAIEWDLGASTFRSAKGKIYKLLNVLHIISNALCLCHHTVL